MSIALIVATLCSFAMIGNLPAPKKDTRLYELRVYYAAPGKLEALHARFRDHTTKLFEKHGITNVGYWVPQDNPNNKLIYLVSFPNREARDASFKEFGADPDWQAAAKASEANGKLVDKIESTFWTATDYSPRIKPNAPKNERVFEFRLYKAAPGKLGDLNARFQHHTVGLIKKYGASVVGFWTPPEKSAGADDTLLYIVAFKSREKQAEMAEKFPKDPKWLRVKEETERDGKLVDKVELVPLAATDYSPIK